MASQFFFSPVYFYLLLMKRRIRGFHRDDEEHWVAELDCGHRQHVRHHPPLFTRDWVLTEEGRESRVGFELDCKRCDEEREADASSLR